MIDKAEDQISANLNSEDVASYLNSLKNFDADILIPVPFRILRKLIKVDRNLKVYFNKFITETPISGYKVHTNAPISFTHVEDLLAEEKKRKNEATKAEKVNVDELTVPELLKHVKNGSE